MAGGRGSRIRTVAPDIPKPMIKIDGKPILQYEIESLRDQGFTDIILTVSHLASAIIDYFKDGSKWGVHISYYHEAVPLGNAGALFKLWQEGVIGKHVKHAGADEDFLLLIADAMFHIDFHRFLAFHKEHKALATLFTHPNSHPYDSGLVVADEESHIVTGWLTKEDPRPRFYKNRVNAGLHILNSAIFERTGIDPDSVGNGRRVDLDRDILKPLVKSGRIFAYDSPEYVKDMGTPERLEAVCADFHAGLVQAGNLNSPQKAIFLDRDGTLNRYVGFLRDIDDFELLPGAAEAVRLINQSGYLAVVVTNQPVVARGEVSAAELNKIHNKMETLLGEHGAYLDAIYVCPHHPDRGFAGEVSELKIDCCCRKPKPGMLRRASRDYHINLGSSWMIGDAKRDIQAGIRAGCRTVLLSTGEGSAGDGKDIDAGICEDYGQTCTKKDLLSAVCYILSKNE